MCLADVGGFFKRVKHLDEETSQDSPWNSLPYVVELRERFAKASQELLEGKKLSAKPMDDV